MRRRTGVALADNCPRLAGRNARPAAVRIGSTLPVAADSSDRRSCACSPSAEAHCTGRGGVDDRTGMMTVVLLILSNVFMTFAWYGHLKYKGVALWKVIGVSWLI